MKRFRLCLVLAAQLAFVCGGISPSFAQLDQADALNKQVISLYQAGRYAEAIPLAQRALAIREKALGGGPIIPDVATSLNNLARSLRNRAATLRPNRSTSARWRSMKKRSGGSPRQSPGPPARPPREARRTVTLELEARAPTSRRRLSAPTI
jgi:hypothetical protein